MFVSSIFDSIKVVKTHSLTLGMQNLFVLIVFIFVMHDYLSREILNQGVYALVRMHRRTKWLVRRMAGLAVICAVYMGIYLTIVYELSSYYVHKRLVIPHSAVLPKAWLALFMMVYFAAVFTVVSDIRIGRSASCIVGAVVLAALIMKSGMRYVCLYNGRKNRFYENADCVCGRDYSSYFSLCQVAGAYRSY